MELASASFVGLYCQPLVGARSRLRSFVPQSLRRLTAARLQRFSPDKFAGQGQRFFLAAAAFTAHLNKLQFTPLKPINNITKTYYFSVYHYNPSASLIQTITMDKFDKIIKWISEHFKLQFNLENISFLLAVLLLVVPLLTRLIKFLIRKYNTKTLSSDLEPFFYPSEVAKAINKFIPTRFQNVNPGNYDDLNNNHAFTVSQNLISHFIKVAFRRNKDEVRYYIILADAGMGKTTFMINLYHRYKKMFNWFGLREKYDIKLFPLGADGVIEAIGEIKNESRNTILLLDAFDEFDPKHVHGNAPMDFLLSKVSRFKEVVITSRTNYFKKAEEEPNKTGLFKLGPNPDEWRFGKFYISPFSNSDVLKYIKKYIPPYKFSKRKKAKELLLNYHDLKFRPMLVSNLWDLIDIPEYHKYNYLIYEYVVEKWIDREVVKTKFKPNYKEELYKFSFELTRYFIMNKSLQINLAEIFELSKNYEINLNELDLTSRSLLNRNVENMYKFSHKTIFEYFASCLLFKNKIIKEDLDFNTNDLILKFHYEMCLNLIIDPLITSLNLKHNEKYDLETKTQMENYLGCHCFHATGSKRQSVLYAFSYDSLLKSKNLSKTLIDKFPKLSEYYDPT